VVTPNNYGNSSTHTSKESSNQRQVASGKEEEGACCPVVVNNLNRQLAGSHIALVVFILLGSSCRVGRSHCTTNLPQECLHHAE
jgi:hypothetical protein